MAHLEVFLPGVGALEVEDLVVLAVAASVAEEPEEAGSHT